VSEKHLAACPAGRLEHAHAPEAEHLLVPGLDRVNVTNRQSKVMDTSDHALLTLSLPRATSRRRVVRCIRRLDPTGPLTA
jgi:hypothetical protein